MSDLEKVAQACGYLVQNSEYADTWEKNKANTAWGALIYHEAQCSGYARAFKALCDGMGISCYYVHADATATIPSHQWNIVKVGGNWYHIDTQAFDSSGMWSREILVLISDKTWSNQGFAWDSSLPKCPADYPNMPESLDFTMPTPVAVKPTATPNSSAVLINGVKTEFDAYTIDGSNYFKLRDIAYVLNGTEKQFNMGYDSATKAIHLYSGNPYTPDGSEMGKKGTGTKTPTLNKATIYLDGKEVSFTVYSIDSRSYFKLYDIGKAFDFYLAWNGSQKTISIDTTRHNSEA